MKIQSIERIKTAVILSALVCLFALEGKAELSGSIVFKDAYVDTVDYGICIVGDEIAKSVYIINSGDKALKVGPISPSFSIEQTGGGGHEFDHEEFRDNLGVEKILTVQPNDTGKIEISYVAERDTNTYPFGLKIAKLKIGIYDDEAAMPPNDTSQFVAYEECILIARKARHYLSGYNNVIDFDSVYVNPAKSSEFTLKVSNASNYDITVTDEFLQWNSPPLYPEEIKVEGETPAVFPPKSGPLNWKVSYFPKNKGVDEALYSLEYSYKDSVDTVSFLIKGVGVEQSLTVSSSNAVDYAADTLDFGKVWVNDSREIYAVLGNSGNCPILARSQSIKNLEDDSPAEDFFINKGLKENSYLHLQRGDTVRLKFAPQRRGEYIARYEIETNLAERVSGTTIDDVRELVYLKGEGVEPFVEVNEDTVKFGTVVWHPDCPSAKSKIIRIRNDGNARLQIYGWSTKAPFSLEPFGETLPSFIEAKSKDSVKLMFSPNLQDDYFGEIQLTTNANQPQDTFSIYITASRKEPSNIILKAPKDIKSKPGRMIAMPILVENSLISNARVFSCELTFDKTLLRYSSYNKLGTAAEKADESQISIVPKNDGGRLSVYVETPSAETYFLNRDTLIKINFASYLGKSISTPISFVNPILGDGVCDKVLLPKDSAGLFTIDSICGLPYKLLPSGAWAFSINNISPNPASNFFDINFSLKYETAMKITIYDERGTALYAVEREFEPGEHKNTVDCSRFPPGAYFIEFVCGGFSKTKKVAIQR